MKNADDKALLPAGLSDRLPPDASFEANTCEALVASFGQHGFERVKPPLVEFEDNLLTGTGAAMTDQTFRLMDPISQRMMGVRADMTPQVARLATTRLAHVPRPLRLCYAGDVLRIRGSQLRPERQFTQAGAEIIGTDALSADAEMVMLAAESLSALGVHDLKIDICQPMLSTAVMNALHLDDESRGLLRRALDRKDRAEVTSVTKDLPSDARALLSELLDATGAADPIARKLEGLKLEGPAKDARDTLLEVVTILRSQAPGLSLTIDAVENRGFEYHCGVTFTILAKGVRGELGSGGRYVAGHANEATSEPAVGFTLFLDSIVRALAPLPQSERVYVTASEPRETLSVLHEQGYCTVLGHASNADASQEAQSLGCTHLWSGGQLVKVGD